MQMSRKYLLDVSLSEIIFDDISEFHSQKLIKLHSITVTLLFMCPHPNEEITTMTSIVTSTINYDSRGLYSNYLVGQFFDYRHFAAHFDTICAYTKCIENSARTSGR